MTKQEASRTIEAILYVSGEPVPVSDLSERLLLTMSEALDALDALQERLEEPESGIQLNRSGGSVYLSIKPACAPDVEKYLQPAKKQPLSQAVMETLSIVAYRQPVTKGEIEQVRGVKCDYSVQALLRGMKPCMAGIILGTGICMILKNAGLFPGAAPSLSAVLLTAALAAAYFGAGRLFKKGISPIALILVSALAGIVVYGG